MENINNLKIELPVELFAPAESLHYDGVYNLDFLKSGVDLYSFDEPVQWSVDITNTGDAFLVTGTAEALAKTGCARCLESTEVELLGEIEGYFVFSDFDESDEDFAELDFEILPDDHAIDLEPLIKSALLLDLPYVALCSEDCKGICPTCGVNLNLGLCNCSHPATEVSSNPAFQALKDYKFE